MNRGIFGYHYHRDRNPWDGASPRELELRAMYEALLEQGEKIMSALDNLNASETRLETIATAILADIQTLSDELAAANSANQDPAIQAVADKLNALGDKLSAVVPAATPPAPPTP